MEILNSIDRENAIKEIEYLKAFLELSEYRGIIQTETYNSLLKYEKALYNGVKQFDISLLKSCGKNNLKQKQL